MAPGRRRLLLIPLVAVGAAAVAGGAGLGVHLSGSEERQSTTSGTFDGETGTVTRDDLEGSTTVTGTLRFSDPRTLKAGLAGVLTRLREPGSVVGLGERLYEVDNAPVFLLRGTTPAWRELGSGMSDGPDVEQLEASLRKLGYFDEKPDETFTWATTEAIMDWQEENGLKRTGRLPLGTVRFADGDLRVGSHTADAGDEVGPGTELFEVTGTSQVVDVDLPLSDQQLAVMGTSVVVHLPDGAETAAAIVSVGTPTETTGADGQSRTVIPMVLTLEDAEAADSFQEAAVRVDVPSARREDVLSVPVGALLAITPEQFGIEVVDDDGSTRRVPVETGLFAGGRVEISGDDVKTGQRVVVPRR